MNFGKIPRYQGMYKNENRDKRNVNKKTSESSAKKMTSHRKEKGFNAETVKGLGTYELSVRAQ